MIRSFARVLALGATAGAAMLAAQSASATAFTFTSTSNLADKSATSAGPGTALNFSSGSLDLSIYGAHLDDTKNSNGLYKVEGATATLYSGAGLGVVFSTDNPNDGTHQLDNTLPGSDFVVLSFSQAVTLNSISRNVFDLPGVSKRDDDASFMAYSGSLSDIPNGLSRSGWGFIDGDGTASVDSPTNSNASSKIWLVAAYVNSTTHDDGFKISNLKVTANTPGAVPEPATWAMMIVGMGAVGSMMRRRKNQDVKGYVA